MYYWQYCWIVLLAGEISCLVINELENWQLPRQQELISNPQRDFLDVDSGSDLVPLTVAIKTLTEPNDGDYRFVDKKGNRFTCRIDYPSIETAPLQRGHNFENIKQLLLNRPKTCYYHKSKNWIYEYCHMKSARQVSRNKVNGIHDEFQLGRYYPPQFNLHVEKDLNYVKTTFDDGSFCRLKGTNRVSHVKYVCANEKPAMYVVEVIEAPVCEYNFIIHVPELCSFLERHAHLPKQPSTIVCFSPDNQPAIKARKEKKSTLSKEYTTDSLTQMLNLIESQYKDSALLLQYKDLLRKASERLQSDTLSKKLESTDSLGELMSQFFRDQSKEDSDSGDREDREDQENRDRKV